MLNFKRGISMLLVLAMLAGNVPPVAAGAEETEITAETTVCTETEAMETVVSEPSEPAVTETEAMEIPETTIAEEEWAENLPSATEALTETQELTETEEENLAQDDIFFGTVQGMGDFNSHERESNDTLATANSIGNGLTMNGKISSFRDIDYFKFKLPYACHLNVVAVCDYGAELEMFLGGGTIGGVYNPDDDELALTLDGGSYYIYLTCDHSSNYKLYLEYWCAHRYCNRKVTEPTCVDRGYTTCTCQNCGESWTEDYTDATDIHLNYTSKVTEPTCGAGGYTTYTCKDCGKTWKDNYTEATGQHSYNGQVTEPTCGVGGYTTYTCTVCGHSKIDDRVPATGEHTYITQVTPPTCAVDGYTTYTCQVCGNSKRDDLVPATGEHTYTSEVTPPTCLDQGYTTYTCQVCGHTKTEDYVEALGGEHSYDLDTLIPPTCSEGGSSTYICKTCGHILVTDFTDATGLHTYSSDDDADCDVCGHIRTDNYYRSGHCGAEIDYWTSEKVYWYLFKDGTLAIVGSGRMKNFKTSGSYQAPWNSYSNEISVIRISDGVTRIGNNAFYQCSQAKKITIGNDVREIGEWVFRYCNKLTSITIPDSVTRIEDSAFYGLDNLKSVHIGNGLKKINDGAFRGHENLTTVSIGDGVEEIGEGAFKNCASLTSVSIGNGVTVIGKEAFDGCSGLTNITIGSGVTVIGESAFDGCSGLTNITIGSGVTVIGESAFEKCTGLTSITIPDNVTRIAKRAFSDCTGLTSIDLGNGVKEIGEFTFDECDALTKVVIPNSVETIGYYAFGDCDKLTEMVIGKGIRYIDRYALDAPKLKKLTFLGDAPILGDYFFGYEKKVTAYYPAGNDTWTEIVNKNTDNVKWVAMNPSRVVLLDQKGNNIGGKTIWKDRKAELAPMTFSATASPEEMFDRCSWKWTDGPVQVDENEDGTVTVTPTGDAGNVVLTAFAGDGTVTSSVDIRFVALSPEREDIPGEDPADMTLLSGKTKQLTLINSDTDEVFDGKKIAWSMDEVYAPYAKLDGKGKLTAKKVVEKVRVEAVGAVIGSEDTTVVITVDIYPAVTKVELFLEGELRNDKTVPVDQIPVAMEISANIYPLDAMDGVTWTVSDKKEAFATYEIRNNILMVTPKENAKPGTVTIKATSADGSKKTATVKLQFGTYAQTVTIDKSITTLTAGDKAIQLNATLTPDTTTKAGIVWSLKNAADKSYVTLSAAGKITPKAVLAPVDVTVVATSKDGMASDEHTIRILPKAAAQLVLKSGDSYVTKTTQTLDVNTQQSITISAHTYGEEAMTEVTWSPLANKAANITVNDDGSLTVQMIAAGSINITAKTADKRSAAVTVKGVQLAQALEISQKKTGITEGLEVASGKSLDLQATLTNAANKKATWSIVEGEAYATISSSGKLAAAKDLVSSHKVTVKACAADGSNVEDTMEIMVRPIAQGVQVYSEEGGRMLFNFRTRNWWVRSNTTLTWDLSSLPETIALDAHVFPYYGEDDAKNAIQAVTWKSSAPKIANIVGGVLEIYKTGSTTITVTAADGSGQKVSFKLNVVKTVTELTIDDQTVQGGKSLNLAKLVTINPTDATNKKLIWTITKGGAYASVSSSGSFKAKKVTASKRVEVTVSSQDGGASAKFTVTINP